MSAQDFDCGVIGGGPGGYVAAIRASQLGLRTVIVESRGALGGTCLNVGCIPSKALLQSSELFFNVAKHGAQHGLRVSDLKLDLDAMMRRKVEIVTSLTRGIEGLMKKNQVTYMRGHGSFVDARKVEVRGNDGKKNEVVAKHWIIATGSSVIDLPTAPLDGRVVVSSTEALSFEKVPRRLVVVGGGVIGLELGSVWMRLGSDVTVVEAGSRILATMDESVSTGLGRILAKQGMKIEVSTRLQGVEVRGEEATVRCQRADQTTLELGADKVLIAVGRRPNTEGLAVDKAGVRLDSRGRVEIDDHFRTSVPSILAIGDVVRGPMLAHKAEDEGLAAAELIAGKAGHVNYQAIPSVVYTWPEVASVGETEEACRARGLDVRVGQFPFAANGRAKCFGSTDGFVKVIADPRTDRVLGVHILGPNASELIAEVAVAVEFSASAEDLARSTHAHPTLAEAIKEACMAVDRRAIHM